MIYLDQAATTAVRREVVEAMWPFLTGEFGNPSSTHGLGLSAAQALSDARARVAAAFGARASEIVFTGGGTEADNLAIKGIALAAPRGRHLITTRIEHEAVLESCLFLERLHGFEVSYAEVDHSGRVAIESVRQLLRTDTTLLTIMYANNEVGTVQPIAEIAALARTVGAYLHTDAVQAAGWLTLDHRALGADAISISGHKLGAPKGVGALFVRGGVPLEPLVHGGGQERGRRSGTENVAGAVGLATALALGTVSEGVAASVAERRDRFVKRVLAEVPGSELTGHPEYRLPGNASFCFESTSGEAILLELEQRDVIVSSGSACAAGRDEPSHVLLALGYPPELAQTAVRFSFDSATTEHDLDAAASALADSVAAVRSLG